MFTQVCFFFCVTSLNIAVIVDTAQVVDEFLANFAGKSTALQVYPFPSVVYWSKADCTQNESCDPLTKMEENLYSLRQDTSFHYYVSSL